MPQNQDKTNAIPRPPVVGILGHIDHGKSTLVDYIRKSNVVATEAGGITQHISAYEVKRTGSDGRERKITFLDTPGHEAFQNVRTRGAGTADIAVLIVSGEDGVKPQTLEVYKHIKESNTPFIVAITKIDKPNADVDRTKQNLAENGIYVEGYGGDISFVPVSAKTGEGVEELLETISLMGDILDLKAEEEVMGEGIIIESKLDPKRGINAVAIVKNGTVSKSTFAVSENGALATLRFILDAEGKQVDSLTFSSPMQVFGWDEMPRVGGHFKTFLKKDEAMEYAREQKELKQNNHPNHFKEDGRLNLPIIIKADTQGSLEAIEGELSKIERERITPRIIASSVGSIGENDIKLAITTPGTMVFGFQTKTDSSANSLAERSGIVIENYSVIYELTDRIRKILEEKEPRIQVEEIIGKAKVLKTFSQNKDKQVIGARVLEGRLALGAKLRLIRREAEVGRGILRELQQAKVSATEVLEGTEFGAMIESRLEIAPGDILEAITLVTK